MLVLLKLDDRFEVQHHEILSQGYHYGIALKRKNMGANLGAREVVVYRGGARGRCQQSPELLYFEVSCSGVYLQKRSPLPDMGDVHQIVDSPHGLVFTDTAHNRVVLIGPNGNIHEYVFGDARRDRNHVNSVMVLGNRILAMLHNRRHRESQIAVLHYDQSRGLKLETLLSLWDVMCHNLYVDGDQLLYHASFSNDLVVVDLSTDKFKQRLSLSGIFPPSTSKHKHVKGLSVCGNSILVGVSEEAARKNRGRTGGCLVVLERESLKIKTIVNLDFLPEPIGNINEIRALDGFEEAQAPNWTKPFDWTKLRLARGDRIAYSLIRLKGLMLTPAIKLKRAYRKHT